MKFSIIADSVFDGRSIKKDIPVTVEDGYISNVGGTCASNTIRVEGMLAPGFIDIQVNGGGGVLFNNTPTCAAISDIVKAHAQFGTTSLLPTIISDKIEIMEEAADAVSSGISQNLRGLIGIHFEGPHISGAKRGVHNEDHFREISEREIALYAREDIGIRHITLAPERVPPEVITLLVELGVLVSLGHSAADYQTVENAIKAGARGFTHIYNAMSPLTSRDPGMVGAALMNSNCWCGLIMDGHHVHPLSAKLAIKSLPSGKSMLVTDAMATVGTDLTEFELLGETITVSEGKLIASEGQLAGSSLDMATAIRNSVSMLGLSKIEALKMASIYPAEFLKISNKTACIEKDKKANLVLLNEDLFVKSTWISGERVYHSA